MFGRRAMLSAAAAVAVITILFGGAWAPRDLGPTTASAQQGGSDHDLGDAPNAYRTLKASGGPCHQIITNSSPRLGVYEDYEADGQPSAHATGDDYNPITSADDEDGVAWGELIQSTEAHVFVDVVGTGYLNAWLDFNGDGDWGDPGEKIATDLSVSTGTVDVPFNVPDNPTFAPTFARFRLSTTTGLGPDDQNTNRCSVDGEVEDYEVTIEPGADLAVDIISDIPDPVAPGAALTYSVHVTNNGPHEATGVELVNGWPNGYDKARNPVSVPSQGTCTPGPNPVECSLGNLPSGGIATVLITVNVASWATGEIKLESSVSGNEAESDLQNNHDTETTTIVAAPQPCCVNVMLVVDVSGSMESGLAEVQQAALSLLGTDGLESTTDYVGLVSFAGDAILESQLTPGAGWQTVRNKINALAIRGGGTNIEAGIREATAELTSGRGGPTCNDWMVLITDGYENIGNARAAAQSAQAAGICIVSVGLGPLGYVNRELLTSISGSWFFLSDPPGVIQSVLQFFASKRCSGCGNPPDYFDLYLTKESAWGAPLADGQRLVYTVRVENLGSAAAANVVVIDRLPVPPVTFVSATPSRGAISTSGTPVDKVTWTLGAMAAGEVQTATIAVDVLCGFAGFTNVADVTTTTHDELSTLNNHAEVTDSQPWCTDLVLEKTADTVTAIEGQRFHYTVTITNVGPGDATQLAFKDDLPAAVSLVSVDLVPAPANPCTYDAAKHEVYCVLDVMHQGDQYVATITVDVNQGAACRFVNTAELVLGELRDRVEGNNKDSVAVALSAARCGDVGDAPDSTNHFGMQMSAYTPPVMARFPTVFDPMTGTPQGPKHKFAGFDIFLGREVSGEAEADLWPDVDGVTNIEPLTNIPNLDLKDDGVGFPLSLTHCQVTMFTYDVTVMEGPHPRFVNAWFDYNRDGDFADTITCMVGGVPYSVPEWAVQNQSAALAPGEDGAKTYTLTSLPFRAYDANPNKPKLWMRIYVSEQQALPDPVTGAPPDGRGPATGFNYGETEDYLLYRLSPGQYQYGAQ
jgi:uncharacterized repeat protein (TIGR01451 family)